MEPISFPVMTWLRCGLVLLLVAVFGWSWRNRGVAVERADAAEVRADSAARVAEEYERAYQSVSAQADMAIKVAEERRDTAVARADRADARRPGIIERIVEQAGPDSAVVRVAVQEVADSIEAHEIRPLRYALAQADSIAIARGREVEAGEAANAALRLALATSQHEAQSWEEAAKPKIFGLFHVDPGPALLIGLGLGVAAGLSR